MRFQNIEHNKTISIITWVAIGLLVIFALGLSLQVFLPDGKKVSDWFHKETEPEVKERPLIAVGDEVVQLYFNQNKSIEEITSMYSKLNKSNSVEGDNSSFRFIKLIEFTDGSNLYLSYSPSYHLYFVGTDGNLNACWPFGFRDEDYYVIDRSGTWNTKTVKAVYQQDVWKDFISMESFDVE